MCKGNYIFRVIDGEYDDGNWYDVGSWFIKDYLSDSDKRFNKEMGRKDEPEDTIFCGDLPEGYAYDDDRVSLFGYDKDHGRTIRTRGKCFGIGEVVILDPTTEREATSPWGGRKPTKWWVTFRDFNNLYDAIEYAKKVTEKHDNDN